MVVICLPLRRQIFRISKVSIYIFLYIYIHVYISCIYIYICNLNHFVGILISLFSRILFQQEIFFSLINVYILFRFTKRDKLELVYSADMRQTEKENIYFFFLYIYLFRWIYHVTHYRICLNCFLRTSDLWRLYSLSLRQCKIQHNYQCLWPPFQNKLVFDSVK